MHKNGKLKEPKFVHTVCIPATILVERQVLDTAWHPLEIPATYAVLK